ncbi:MAG: hypothetical protein PUA59_07520 [Clostridium sp.]|nr:hypothetical protein [Clostridium sp.]
MKKVIIGIVVAVLLLVGVYFLLPAGPKNVIQYQWMKMFDKETYAEIEVVQNTIVLGQDSVTYEDIISTGVSHEYWTYETNVSATGAYQKIITANGDGVSLTLGENDDSGVYDDAELQLVFTLDSKGGYDLVAYMDGTQLSKADRDSLLEKLSQQVK